MVMVLLKYGISHMEQDLSKLAIRLFKIFKDMYVHNFLCGEKFINVTDPAMARYGRRGRNIGSRYLRYGHLFLEWK